MVSLPIFLVVPEWHITQCPTNGLLARCIQRELLSLLSPRANFIRLPLCGMVTSLDTACIGACIGPQCKCRDSIIIRSAIHVLQPNDMGPMALSAPIHSQRDPHHVWAFRNCQGGLLDHAGRKLFHQSLTFLSPSCPLLPQSSNNSAFITVLAVFFTHTSV